MMKDHSQLIKLKPTIASSASDASEALVSDCRQWADCRAVMNASALKALALQAGDPWCVPATHELWESHSIP